MPEQIRIRWYNWNVTNISSSTWNIFQSSKKTNAITGATFSLFFSQSFQ